MENTSAAVFENMVNSFTNEDELMNFAATWGIQDSPGVRFRLFQLRNPQYGADFVDEELSNILQQMEGPNNNQHTHDLDLALEYVREQEEVEECIKALLFDGEMGHTANVYPAGEEWNPQSPVIQIGSGNEPQPGPPNEPPGLRYTVRKKSEKTFAKNAAVDRTYQVKIDEHYRSQNLIEVRQSLHQLFDEILGQARSGLAENDLGRVVIQHDGLHDPIIIPLQRWDTLNADTVMKIIEKVLNSNQTLSIDESFYITIGTIELPKGGARRRITNSKGKNNSLKLKTSIVPIENDDQLCMARAIGVSWAKLKKCTKEDWNDIVKNRQKKSNLKLVLENRQVPENYYRNLLSKQRGEQNNLAEAISQLAGVPLDRPASLNDLEAFEKVLGVRVMVVSARLGNKFITCPSNDERPCIYLYLVDDNHFHAITSITGFFSAIYFCHKCLQHYCNRENHQCDNHCIVCKRDGCLKADTSIDCQDCNMTCRSLDCYHAHLKKPMHKRGKFKGKVSGPSLCKKLWKCPTCYKVVNREKREKEDHRCGEYYCSSCETFVLDDHVCYLRSKPAEEEFKPKFIFFDFECTQDQLLECQEGYISSEKPDCKDCRSEKLCKLCSKCSHCQTSWCGKATHRPNYVVAHSVCPDCIDKPLNPDSVCKKCGTRCETCDNINLFANETTRPCASTCGLRETIFEGEDTAEQFGQWLFSEQHRRFKAVAHNMKGYDGYFLLEYIIDKSMKPDNIIYNGSKIMYMAVEKGLHIKVIDSLNFLPMKLASLPKAFG